MSDLAELGLSSYEEKVYRALLALGPSSARDVSELSDVPMGRIYDVLNALEARRIVRSQSGEPRRYVPIDPEDAVDRLLDERLRELERERDRYRELADAVGSELAPTPPTDGNVWTTTLGSEDAITLLREQLRAASETVLLAVGAPYETAAWDAQRAEFLAFVDEIRPGLDVRLLVSDALVETLPDEPFTAIAETDVTVPVRRLGGLHVTFDVVDGTGAYLDVPHPFIDGERFGFVAVQDGSIARQLEREFEAVWEDATPVRW